MTDSWKRKFRRTSNRKETIFKIFFFWVDLQLFEAKKYVLRIFSRKKNSSTQTILEKYKKFFDYSELELGGGTRVVGFGQPNFIGFKGKVDKLSITKFFDLYENNNSSDLRCWVKLNVFFFYSKMVKSKRLSRLWAEKKRFLLRKLFLKHLKFFNKFK